MTVLLNSEQLYTWANCKQKSKLIRWLNDNHIPYRLDPSGNPVTTSDAVNGSLIEQVGDRTVGF